MENFLTNYLASVTAGVTLGIIGLTYYNSQKNINQDNKVGDNINIKEQNNFNMSGTKQTKDVNKKLKKYEKITRKN